MRTKPRYAEIRETSHRAARMDKVDRTATVTSLDFQAPVKTVSEANQREHWAVKNERKNAQQLEVSTVLHNNLLNRKVRLPCVVKLTRIGPRALDTDNLAGAMKHVQDAIARKLGVDDGDTEKVRWEYHQMPIRIREYAVKVSIISV